MKKAIVLSIVFVVFSTSFVSAEMVRGIDIDFVTIGNAGNVGDTRTETDKYGNPLVNPYGCGAVSYNYRIGKYEVTNAQWNTYTATGTPTGNPSSAYDQSAYFTGNQQPTTGVSWCEAAQFCNYLTSGDKSKGAYRFSGNNANPGSYLGIDRVSSISTYGTTYVIPTEDEWYKAAYFKPDGSGYSTYANGTNTAPIAGVQSNYYNAIGAPWDITNGIQEQNGTFNMMGNVWEWNETPFYVYAHGIRGGSYGFYSDVSGDECSLTPTAQYCTSPDEEDKSLGFRIASIPEPCSFLLLGLGAMIIKKRFVAV